jgi:hypothetical protein
LFLLEIEEIEMNSPVVLGVVIAACASLPALEETAPSHAAQVYHHTHLYRFHHPAPHPIHVHRFQTLPLQPAAVPAPAPVASSPGPEWDCSRTGCSWEPYGWHGANN